MALGRLAYVHAATHHDLETQQHKTHGNVICSSQTTTSVSILATNISRL